MGGINFYHKDDDKFPKILFILILQVKHPQFPLKRGSFKHIINLSICNKPRQNARKNNSQKNNKTYIQRENSLFIKNRFPLDKSISIAIINTINLPPLQILQTIQHNRRLCKKNKNQYSPLYIFQQMRIILNIFLRKIAQKLNKNKKNNSTTQNNNSIQTYIVPNLPYIIILIRLNNTLQISRKPNRGAPNHLKLVQKLLNFFKFLSNHNMKHLKMHNQNFRTSTKLFHPHNRNIKYQIQSRIYQLLINSHRNPINLVKNKQNHQKKYKSQPHNHNNLCRIAFFTHFI